MLKPPLSVTSGAFISPHRSVPQARLRSVLWPTPRLDTGERLFDELYVWTEGAQARTTLRASIQHVALQKGFAMLEEERVRHLVVTLSFGTIERNLDAISSVIEDHLLLCHRLSVLVRGDMSRIRSRYRIHGFLDWLRSQHIAIGYRLDARLDRESEAVDVVEPSFVKLMAPTSTNLIDWEHALAQTVSFGIDAERIIAAGLETDGQKQLACDAGFLLGQGTAVAPWQSPPALKRPTPAWPDLQRPGALR
jgi:hypothetical protein